MAQPLMRNRRAKFAAGAALVAVLLLETMSRAIKTQANRASKKSNRRVTTTSMPV